MIKIVSDGTVHGTYFYDEEGRPLNALRSSCLGVTIHQLAGEPATATIEVFAGFEMSFPKASSVRLHPLDEMVHRANKGQAR